MLSRTFDWIAWLSLDPRVQFLSETREEAVALSAKHSQGCGDLVECEILARRPLLPSVVRRSAASSYTFVRLIRRTTTTSATVSRSGARPALPRHSHRAESVTM